MIRINGPPNVIHLTFHVVVLAQFEFPWVAIALACCKNAERIGGGAQFLGMHSCRIADHKVVIHFELLGMG